LARACGAARSALEIKVAGSRVFGPPNVNLSDGHQRRMLLSSLDLPVGAVMSGWETLVLRDGDPVMVLGFKQTVADPGQHAARQVPLRATLGSLADQPMLVFTLDAERRPAPAPSAPVVRLPGDHLHRLPRRGSRHEVVGRRAAQLRRLGSALVRTPKAALVVVPSATRLASPA